METWRSWPLGGEPTAFVLNSHVISHDLLKYWCVYPCICAAVNLGQRNFFVPWAEVNSENHNWSTCWKRMPELSRLKTLISSFNSFTSRRLDTGSSCSGYTSGFHTQLPSELLNPLKNTKRLKITEFHKNKSSYTKLLWSLNLKAKNKLNKTQCALWKKAFQW